MDIKEVANTVYEYAEKIIIKEMEKIKENDLVKVGYCPMCNVEMVSFNKVTKQPLKIKDNYRDYWIKLTNGKKTRIAICKDCVEKVDDKFIKEQMRKLRNTQAYGSFINPNIDISKKIRGILLGGSYESIKHGKKEKDLEENNGNTSNSVGQPTESGR
ncbi:MAG: hypothetical protein ACFFG0_03405 [Candidatus Thorarchaeota archaeon]